MTADVAAGTGGIDASIGFETDRPENVGVAFNDSLFVFSFFISAKASSKFQLLAIECWNVHSPLDSGRSHSTWCGRGYWELWRPSNPTAGRTYRCHGGWPVRRLSTRDRSPDHIGQFFRCGVQPGRYYCPDRLRTYNGRVRSSIGLQCALTNAWLTIQVSVIRHSLRSVRLLSTYITILLNSIDSARVGRGSR